MKIKARKRLIIMCLVLAASVVVGIPLKEPAKKWVIQVVENNRKKAKWENSHFKRSAYCPNCRYNIKVEYENGEVVATSPKECPECGVLGILKETSNRCGCENWSLVPIEEIENGLWKPKK